MTVSPSCCASMSACRDTPASGAPVTAIRTCIRQHTSAYVSMGVRLPQHARKRRARDRYPHLHTSAYVSMRQHTSAYVSARDRAIRICSSMRTYIGLIH